MRIASKAHTQWVVSTQGDKNQVHDMVHFFPAKGSQVRILKFMVNPISRTICDVLREAKMHVCGFWRNNDRLCADLDTLGTSRAGEGAGPNDEMDLGF